MSRNAKYNDSKFRYLHPKDQLVMIMQRVYQYEMTTTSGGNISVKDEDGVIWITPGGIDKGSLTREDMVWITTDGKVHGKHVPSSEYPFHRAIYEARPDLKAILHAHPPALVAFSAAGLCPRTDILPNTRNICGEVEFVPYALPGSEELGRKIAAAFAGGTNMVILENHGTVTAAEDLFQAFMQFETLDFTARIQIKARVLGNPRKIADGERETARRKSNELPEFTPGSPGSGERELRQEMCRFIHRSYDQRLFTSTEGTFAVRVGEDEFLITPYGFDRKYMEPRDIVLVKEGKREAGKLPSRSVLLHRAIFRRRPEINAIIIAHSANLMAFNVSETLLDSRIIPEAYILMRDLQTLPFEAPVNDHELVVERLTEANPLLMIQNNGFIVTADSLLKAFDRLEVADYTAEAVLGAYQLGKVRVMEDELIDDLKVAFKLKE
ncbi:MAG: class II aldolase/adducin family protein [Spirochaetales bacterium]|nr:class II aldolase/adducin family protein [Spirochaetales bacterium]